MSVEASQNISTSIIFSSYDKIMTLLTIYPSELTNHHKGYVNILLFDAIQFYNRRILEKYRTHS